MSDDGNELTVLGHIGEFRKRLVRSVIAVTIVTIIAFIFARQIFYFLILPAEGINLIYVEMTEMIGTYMKVCLAAGIVVTMPYITYQALMFVSPALSRSEKKYMYLVMPWVGLMFIAGVAFGYFILLPPATKFLITFGSDIATPQIKIGNYIGLITRLLLAIGFVFEMPVITTFLSRIGIIKPKWLSDKRKIAIIFAFILAALITPTFDPINQILVAVPLVILYELSILLSKLVYKKKVDKKTPVSSPAA